VRQKFLLPLAISTAPGLLSKLSTIAMGKAC
jgi:hypothetical protein